MICPHADICGVCRWIDIPWLEQIERKRQLLQQALQAGGIPHPCIEFREVAEQNLRDRVDLIIERGRLGYYQKDRRENFSLQQCPLMTPALFDFFQEVQKISFPIEKGSLRLRVSPQGLKGVWLDFANTDIRDLLTEKTSLQALLQIGFVEIGQRRKKLTETMKLVEPEFHTWTRTWVQGEAWPLWSLVGGFSQSGDRANQVIIRELESFLTLTKAQRWLEFGSGHGNLTFPLAGKSREVLALEIDDRALQALQKNLPPDFSPRVQIQAGDFQRKTFENFQSFQGVLVNPPRSGLGQFLQGLTEIPSSHRPQELIYMSCFLESFAADAQKLHQLDYQIQRLSILDQFPQGPHFEILSLWTLPNSAPILNSDGRRPE